MAKVSEFSDQGLEKLISKYEKFVSDEPNNPKYKKTLTELKKELNKRSQETSKLDTENNQEEFSVAPLPQRLVAYLIDGTLYLIFFGICLILAYLTGHIEGEFSKVFKEPPSWFEYPLNLIITIFHIYLIYSRGASIGKSVMGLQIISTKGSKNLSILQVVCRTLLQPFLINIDIAVVFFSEKRLHFTDKIVKTRVISNHKGRTKLPKKEEFGSLLFFLISLPTIVIFLFRIFLSL